jgi:hypothetical protein
MSNASAPPYPGYHAPCNGCGECCRFGPCHLSSQYGLWREGACVALRFGAGRYWCDVITQPQRISARLPKIPRRIRQDAIGIVGICDAKKA